MAKPQEGQQTGRTWEAGQPWMLGPGAPDWFRRIWNERVRTAPRAQKLDPNRIRRIAYL